ncbi:MAG TPA: hypothetical protein VH374_23490 [Polyangia bacterium]|jgi:hypothetical protein|nr:hypothetical protein [Polyangia bacterium]
METLQKAGAYALIVGVKCLRRALITLADIQDAAKGTRPDGGAEMRALRDEVDAMRVSLRQIKATLSPDQSPADARLLQ